MKFAAAQYLWLLCGLPVVILVLWRARAQRVRQLLGYWGASTDLDAKRLIKRARRWRSTVILTVATALLIVAIARPQWGFTWRPVPALGGDIFLVVDVSNSMLAQDVKPSRIEQVRREIFDLLARGVPARIGLIVFAGAAFVYCPLTSDHEALRMFVEDLDPGMMSRQGTALGPAVDLALQRLNAAAPEESSGQVIIAYTDGEDQELSAEQALRRASASGVALGLVGVGTTEGAPIPAVGGGFKKDTVGRVIVSRLGEAMLQKLADTAGGVYVRAEVGDADLMRILELVPQAGADSEDRGQRRKVWHEQYAWFAALVFLLLLYELVARSAAWRDFFVARKKTMQQRSAFLLFCCLSIQFSDQVFADSRSEAFAAFRRGDFAVAADKFLELEVDEPTQAQHIYNRSVSQFQSQQFTAARDGFAKSAQSSDPTLAAASYYNLGNTEVALNDLNAAIAAYEKALQITPHDEAAKENLAWAKDQLKSQQQKVEASRDSDQRQQDSQKAADHQMSSQAPGSHSNQAPHSPEKNASTPENSASAKSGSESPPSGASQTHERPESQPGQSQSATSGLSSHDQQQKSSENSSVGAQAADAAGVSVDQQQAQRTLRRVKDAKHRRVLPPAANAEDANNPGIDDAERDW